MMQRMSAFELLRPEVAKNELRETIKTWTSVGTISAALSVAAGSKQELNQALRVSSTHRAVTTDQVEVYDRLRAVDGSVYLVDYIIPGEPYSQLFLTKEEPAGKEDSSVPGQG